MADYKSKKAGNRSARRPFIYTGRVTSLRTTPCRHRAEDKLLRLLEIRLGVEGVGVDAYLVARTPAAWKASECLVEDHLWRSSRARGGATVHVYIGHRSTPGYTIDRADDTNGPRRVVHPDRHTVLATNPRRVSPTIAFSALFFSASSPDLLLLLLLPRRYPLSLLDFSRRTAWRLTNRAKSSIVRRRFLAAGEGGADTVRGWGRRRKKGVARAENRNHRGNVENTRGSRVAVRKHHRQLGSRGPFQPVFLANGRGMEGSNGGRSFQASV